MNSATSFRILGTFHTEPVGGMATPRTRGILRLIPATVSRLHLLLGGGYPADCSPLLPFLGRRTTTLFFARGRFFPAAMVAALSQP